MAVRQCTKMGRVSESAFSRSAKVVLQEAALLNGGYAVSRRERVDTKGGNEAAINTWLGLGLTQPAGHLKPYAKGH